MTEVNCKVIKAATDVINSLYQKGTLEGCRHLVKRLRQEQDYRINTKDASDMDKVECITEITGLWSFEKKPLT